MKLGLINTLLASTLLLVAVACSHQNRQSDPKLSSGDMLAMLDEAQSPAHIGDSGAALSQVNSMLQDKADTTVYFNDGPRKGRRLSTIAPLHSLNFLLPADALKNGSLSAIRIFFIEHAGDHKAILVIGVIQSGDGPQKSDEDVSSDFMYYSFGATGSGTGIGKISGGEYTITFDGKDGNPFTLRSRDVKGDNLNAAIQFSIYTSVHGQNTYVGKFSSLAGYQ